MKNMINALLVMVLLAVAIPGQSMVKGDKAVTETSADAAEAQRLIHRLEEIKAMDKTYMPRDQKKALRVEVKASKKRLKEIGGGVYLSAGAVILIIVLLIIFL